MENKRLLRAIHIEPSGICNLRCKYCYNSRFEDDKSLNKVPFEKWIDIVDDAWSLGCRDFAISGGEFLIYPQCKELINYIAQKGVTRIAVFSNAMRITDIFLDSISSIEPKIEFRISFDGYLNADAIRVGSSYQKIIKNLQLLRSNKFPVVINTLALETNYSDFNRIYNDIRKIGVQKWLIDFPFKQGRADGFIKNLIPSTEVLITLCDIVKKYVKEAPDFALEIQNLFKSQMLKGKFFSFDLDSGVCSYIGDGITIHSDGNVTICPTLFEFCGNIMNQSLYDILISKERKKLLSIKVGDLNKCSKCRYVNICGGGCRADALSERGSLLEFDPVACCLMKTMESYVLPILPQNMRNGILALLKGQ